MALNIIGTLPLGGINIAAGAALTLLAPLMVQFDLVLFGSLGLGALELDLSLQLNASISATLSLGISIDNISLALSALASVQANLALMLSLGLPALNLNASLNIGASLQLSAFLALKLGGIQAMISAALAIKLPIIDFMANLEANLSASCVLAEFGFSSPNTLSEAGTSINSFFQTGFEGIGINEPVYGVIIMTKQPSASVSLSAMIAVS